MVTRKAKNRYIRYVKSEMAKRGMSAKEIDCAIGKTGFLEAVEKFPEEQLHYPVEAAVWEILVTAAGK